MASLAGLRLSSNACGRPRGRPYAVELRSARRPAAGDLGVLRSAGRSCCGGRGSAARSIIGVDPIITAGGSGRGGLLVGARGVAASFWAGRAELGADGVGGGWFTVLGYDPGSSWLAFCDSLLRRRADGTWVFESLGLIGREQAAARPAPLAPGRVRAAAGAALRPEPCRGSDRSRPVADLDRPAMIIWPGSSG